MYILKRSWYYITRKRGKSITIGIILFVVATLVLTGLLINNAANKTFKVAKDKLGSNIIYKSDTTSVMQEQMNNSSNSGQQMKPGKFTLPDDYTNLTTKEVETIAKNSKYVKSYSFNTSYTANPVDFEEYDTSNSDNDNESNSSDENNNTSKKFDMASLSIAGVENKSDVINSNSTLSSGSFFTEDEISNGKNVVMIEKSLADLNGLKVGDEITVEQVTMRHGESSDDESSVQVTYTIVGIYESEQSTDVSNQNFTMAMNNVENKLYVPYMSILKMQEIGLSNDELETLQKKGYKVEQATFIIDDPDNSDAFIKEVKAMKDIDMTYRSLSIDNEAYEKMVGNIESVASTAKVLVTVVIIAGIAIIMLLSMLTIKDRKYEIGVLLSLGESKLKVLIQLVSEILIIGIISFTLATLTTSFLAQKMTNYLLNNEVSSVETIDMNNIDKNNGGNMNNNQSSSINQKSGEFGRFKQNRPNTSSLDVEVVDELTVSLTPVSIISLYGVGLLIIIIGNVLQSIFVLRLNPKEIMLDR